jgi:hypothetical protein
MIAFSLLASKFICDFGADDVCMNLSYSIRMRLISFFAVFAALTAEAQAGRPRTIIVYAGVPHSGPGDMAANWVMAQYLKQISPQDRVVFAVDEDARALSVNDDMSVASTLKALIPEYLPYFSSRVDGVEIISVRTERVPLADYGLSFSTRAIDGLPQWLIDRSRFSFFFEEPSGFSDSHPIFRVSTHPSASRAVVVKGRGAYVMMSTGPMARGIYVPPVVIQPRLTRSAMLMGLDQSLRHNFLKEALMNLGLRRHPFRNHLLGFSDSDNLISTQRYVDAMKTVAVNPRYLDRQIAIFVRENENLKLQFMPSNLKVIQFDQMPLKFREALIAYADFPVQLTDHVSMSQAIHHHKTFLGDPLGSGNHTGALMAILRKMIETNSSLSRMELEKLYKVGGVMQECMLTREQRQERAASADFLSQMILCTEFRDEFERTLNSLHREWSLVWRVMMYLSVLDDAEEHLTSRNFEKLAQLLNQVDSPNGRVQPEFRSAEKKCQDQLYRMAAMRSEAALLRH